MAFLQFGIFTESDDFAEVYVNKRWMRVPAWLACQWDEASGGVYGIVKLYNLEQLTIFRPYEYKAMDRIRSAARALKKFYAYGETGALSDVEKRCLRIEQDTRTNHAHLKGEALYEHIAMTMGADYTPRQVRGILQDAEDVLIQQESEIEDEYYTKLARRIAKLNARLEIAA